MSFSKTVLAVSLGFMLAQLGWTLLQFGLYLIVR